MHWKLSKFQGSPMKDKFCNFTETWPRAFSAFKPTTTKSLLNEEYLKYIIVCQNIGTKGIEMNYYYKCIGFCPDFQNNVNVKINLLQLLRNIF